MTGAVSLHLPAVALEVLVNRGGAEICATIPTSGGLRPPPCYRNMHHAYHALCFNKSHSDTA